MATTINADTSTGGAILTGDGSGELALQAAGVTKLTVTSSGVSIPTLVGANVNLTTALTLAGAAGTNGQVLTSAGSGLPSWTTVSSGLTLGTPVVTTSGTSIDFTGIPAEVKQIFVSFKNVTITDPDQIIIQLGDSGGVETTGYSGLSFNVITGNAPTATLATTGFGVYTPSNSVTDVNGVMTLILENSTAKTWAMSGIVAQSNTARFGGGAGSKSLSATLDRIRITTLGGTFTFSGGEINIAYS